MGCLKKGKIEGVILTPLKIIDSAGGKILHAMKKNDLGYSGFGEAYFSMVERGFIKGWKRHKKMTLNIIVPVGSIRFVIYDDRKDSPTNMVFQDVTLSKNNYQRLSVPPMLWMAFQGLEDADNILLNLANIKHVPEESEKKFIEEIGYLW